MAYEVRSPWYLHPRPSSKLYTRTDEEYASHKTTNHAAGEYVRYEGGAAIHSNTIENVFSVFKRGMIGVYQHCGEAHLHRYLAESDFRYNRRSALGVEDRERARRIVRPITPKQKARKLLSNIGRGKRGNR